MSVKREALILIGLVLVVDATFVALYFLSGVRGASAAIKVAFTVLWTLLTLLVVVGGLSRVRKARMERRRW
jgi:hypothetical protein